MAKLEATMFICGFLIGILIYFVIFPWPPSAYFVDFKRLSEEEIILKLTEELDETGVEFIKTMNKIRDLKKDDNFEEEERRANQTHRIFCIIFAEEQYMFKRSLAVYNTWGKRCNDIRFLSTKPTRSHVPFYLVHLDGLLRHHPSSRELFYRAAKFAYRDHYEDADWFLFATDDTYVIMENLYYFLSGMNSSEPLYLGKISKEKRIENIHKKKYSNTVILSKSALQKIPSSVCYKTCIGKPTGDIFTDLCLYRADIQASDIYDKDGRQVLNVLPPEMRSKTRYPIQIQLPELVNTSTMTVSFRSVKHPKIYALELYVYHLRPFGIINT